MCGGVEIMLTDYKNYRSVETALHIIDAYQKTSPDSLVWTPPQEIKRLEDPEMEVNDVVEACQEEISEFLEIREKYLIYR